MGEEGRSGLLHLKYPRKGEQILCFSPQKSSGNYTTKLNKGKYSCSVLLANSEVIRRHTI